MAQGDALLEAGVIKRAGANTPGWTSNLGLAAATTTNANDSIKITGADGTALSVQNPGHITLPSTTAGQLSTFTITADVTIDLTGAHWGLGTLGDFTDIELRIYPINDTESLKWGISNKGGLISISDSNSSATATDVTSQEKMLVNSSLNSGTWPCSEVGWFNANFDDTGGASEDLWEVQTGVGDINVGIPVDDDTDYTSFSPTGSWSTNTTYTGYRRRVGDTLELLVDVALAGAPDATAFTLNLPSGLLLDTNKRPGSYGNFGTADVIDSGTAANRTIDTALMTSSTAIRFFSGSNGTGGELSSTVPFTFASGDAIRIKVAIPILGWSSN